MFEDKQENWLDKWDRANGYSDMFDESIETHEIDSIYYDRGARSTIWSGRTYEKFEDPEKKANQMRRIRDAVSGLLRVHGIPRGTDISVAGCGNEAAALAGFRDMKKFTGPFMRIGSAIIDEISNEDDILDVYCGLGLHEASHLNHTRKGFCYKESGEIHDKNRIWSELLEDERIEDKVRDESPGFIQYVVATKKALFDDKEVGGFFKNWDAGSDVDKIHALFFSFIRTPYLLNDEHQVWETVEDRCVYDELREALPKRPTCEEDVLHGANILQKLFESLTKPYDEAHEKLKEALKELSPDGESTTSDSGDGSDGESGGDSDGASDETDKKPEETSPEERNSKYEEVLDKLSDDADVKRRLEHTHHKTTVAEEHAKKSGDLMGMAAKDKHARVRDISGEATEAAADGDMSSLEMSDKSYSSKVKKIEDILKIRGSRADFGRVEIERMLRRFDTVEGAMSAEETCALERVDAEKVTELDKWDSGGYDRRTVIRFPVSSGENKKNYTLWKSEVQTQINRMRQVFRMKQGSRDCLITERKEGRLHRRMLSKVRSTDRLFTDSYRVRGKGVHLNLLLDESGSMGSVYLEGESRNTARAAVCISEGVKGVKNILLEVYSHTSCGENHKDCLVKYLHGPSNPKLESIGGYAPGYQNYDHRAIEVVVDRMMKSKVSSDLDFQKVLIVLSDGSPCGTGYGGNEANRQTKKAVQDAKRKGIVVIQVAIGGYGGSKNMYDHVIEFTDMQSLTSDMRRLIQKIVK